MTEIHKYRPRELFSISPYRSKMAYAKLKLRAICLIFNAVWSWRRFNFSCMLCFNLLTVSDDVCCFKSNLGNCNYNNCCCCCDTLIRCWWWRCELNVVVIVFGRTGGRIIADSNPQRFVELAGETRQFDQTGPRAPARGPRPPGPKIPPHQPRNAVVPINPRRGDWRIQQLFRRFTGYVVFQFSHSFFLFAWFVF